MTRVYADMVGDLFHAGHVEFLQQARALGDELVVGLHSDDDCEWFKRRPVLTLDERVRVVGACRYVDRVIPSAPVFTTESWVRAQAIDLVVHGDDISERSLRYWYRVPMELGIFRTVPYTHGISSTELAERLREPEPPASQPGCPRRRIVEGLRRASPSYDRAVQRRAFVGALQDLVDALRGTPLDGHYWVFGGLLIGWAREGRVLASDLRDADFAYLDEDHDRFLASISALVDAGFAPRRRFSSANGRYVEHRFHRGGANFEFFRVTPVGDRWRYSVFVRGSEAAELVAEIPAQPRVPFTFLDRTWQKVAGHDAELTAIYGDWRTPRPDWSYTSDRAVVERIPMALLPHGWAWPDSVTRGPGERHLPTVSKGVMM